MDETNGPLPGLVASVAGSVIGGGGGGNGGNLTEMGIPKSTSAFITTNSSSSSSSLSTIAAVASAAREDGIASSSSSVAELQQQMLALQQAFQQKQADLLYHFQQSQAQLALQHYQLSQQLLRDAARRRQQVEAAAAAAAAIAAAASASASASSTMANAGDRELQRIASDPLAQHNHHQGGGGGKSCENNNGIANLIGVSASEFDLSRGAAGGSGAISVRTREKLKAHLANKQRLRRRSTQTGSPHFEPYPVPSNCAADDGTGSLGGASNDDYDLRKTRSEPNLKMMPPRGAFHHHLQTTAALRAKLHKQQQQQQHLQQQTAAGHYDTGPLANMVRTMSAGGAGNDGGAMACEDAHMSAVGNADSVMMQQQQHQQQQHQQQQQQQQQQQSAAAAAALSAFFTTPSLPNIAAYHQARHQSSASSLFAAAAAGLPTESFSSAMSSPLFFSVPSMLPYLNAAALQQAAAVGAVTSNTAGAGSPWTQQPGGRPLFDFAGGGGLVEGNRRNPSSAFAAASHQLHAGHGGNGGGGSHGLLKQQLRDLLLRRRSLVPEETADELKSETMPSSSSSFSSSLMGASAANGKNCAGATGSQQGLISCSLKGTGLAYDNLMCKHQCICGDNSQHVEHGGRVQSIWARLQETGLVDECEKISGRKAPIDYLKLCHGDSYTTFFAVSPSACLRFDPSELPLKEFVQLPCGGIGVDSDTYFNDAFTPSAARLAAGCCIELCCAVAEGRLKNGFAVVRPPGHHAEPDQALGFCFFNNVAIAAQVLRKKYGVKKVAIVDWDVHHGNGTQLIFEEDPDVLYLSLHRHDNGNFFPGTGAITDVGVGAGRGTTVNVAWSGESMGDPEYLAAWRVLTLPILDRFHPDFILVSAGFDAANGHRAALGGYKLSAALFGYFTKSLVSRYAGGKVVLVLEGGYDLAVISEAAEQCVRSLKEASSIQQGGGGQPGASSSSVSVAELSHHALSVRPNASAQQTLARVVEVQKHFWPSLTADGAVMSQSEWLSNLPKQFASLTMDATTSSSVSTDEKGDDDEEDEDEDEPLEVDDEVEEITPDGEESRRN